MVGSWVCGWVDGLILEWVFPWKVFLGGRLWMVVVGFFLRLRVMVVVRWLVAMGFVVGYAMDRHGLF